MATLLVGVAGSKAKAEPSAERGFVFRRWCVSVSNGTAAAAAAASFSSPSDNVQQNAVSAPLSWFTAHAISGCVPIG